MAEIGFVPEASGKGITGGLMTSDTMTLANCLLGFWIDAGLVVLALLVVGLAWAVVRVRQRHRRNRYRREAAAELRGIEARLGSTTTREAALAELPVLVKRVALHLAPRGEVAALSGPSWLAFLDRTWKGDAFRAGPGRLLPEIAYGTPTRLAALPPAELEPNLLALLRAWIRGHRR